MDEFFYRMTGNPNLWNYQKRVANLLNKGENVILRAATGSGKTWAALIGFLFSKYYGKPCVDRIIYALPLRSLASNLFHSTRAACGHTFCLTDDLWRTRVKQEIAITIQTGEQQDDRFFLGDICFTTIDQLLSGYLNVPCSLPEKLSNINAGSLIGSLVIIDEIHLLEPEKSLWTLLEMKKRLKPFTQFLFMTATLSKSAINLIRDYLKAEVCEIPQEELSQMAAMKNKQRTIHWENKPLNAANVIKHHHGKRSIVICNTVRKAQEIYQDIKRLVHDDYNVILLHSRFYPQDRLQKEKYLEIFFGPNAHELEKNTILITTQVVEAGIDISAENLHTELCPANSLLQRAGRCGRYPERNIGDIWVYELEKSENGQYKFGPYRDEHFQKILGLTRKAVQDLNGRLLSFEMENKIINDVHQEFEHRIINELLIKMKSRRDAVNSAIDLGAWETFRNLIRDVNSINILLSDNPEKIDLDKNPFLISIPRTSFYSLKDKLIENNLWQHLKIPIYNADDDSYYWKELSEPKDFSKISWLISGSSEIASYSTDIGLQLGVMGKKVEVKYKAKPIIQNISYDFETYYDHIQKVVLKNREYMKSFSYGIKFIEKALDLPKGTVSWLTDLTCALHDIGKLTEGWLKAAWAWQIDNYPEKAQAPIGQPLAHITFNSKIGDGPKQKANNRYKRGHHALEGAFAIVNSLYEYFLERIGDPELAEMLTRVVVSVISHHHVSRVKEVESFTLTRNAVEIVNKSLEKCSIHPFVKELSQCCLENEKIEFKSLLLQASMDEIWIPLYWFLIRRLRIADQASLKP